MSLNRRRPGPRWFVWFRPADQDTDTEEVFETMDLALDRVLALVEQAEITSLKLCYVTDSDCRVLWDNDRGFRHATPYARNYLSQRMHDARA